MKRFWPGLSKNSSEKTWEYQACKHMYELPCTEEEYLAHATRLGKSCINTFLSELRKQENYVFGSNEKYSCKEFQQWVNKIYKHKVDCRFRQLYNDKSYFGLEKIGVLGKLYLDNLEWEIVNLVISEDNVEEAEKINDTSQFYLQHISESVRLQARNIKMGDDYKDKRNSKMQDDKGKRKMGLGDKSAGKKHKCN